MKTHAYKNFTTTLPVFVLNELDMAAKALNVQKNDILISAITLWNKARKQKELAQSYSRVSEIDTQEMMKLADEGFDDWYKNLPV